jgi:hypothetical protein
LACWLEERFRVVDSSENVLNTSWSIFGADSERCGNYAVASRLLDPYLLRWCVIRRLENVVVGDGWCGTCAEVLALILASRGESRLEPSETLEPPSSILTSTTHASISNVALQYRTMIYLSIPAILSKHRMTSRRKLSAFHTSRSAPLLGALEAAAA